MRDGKQLPRHIVATFRNISDRHEIMRNKSRVLKDTGFFITDDLTEADVKRKRELQPVMEQARREGKNVKFRHGKLYIDGNIFRGNVPNRSQERGPSGNDTLQATGGAQAMHSSENVTSNGH